MTDRRTRQFNNEREKQLKRGLDIRRDTYKTIVDLLRDAEKDIINTLKDSPTEYQAFYLQRLIKSVRAALSELSDQAGLLFDDAIDESWSAGIALVEQPLLSGGVRIAELIPAISVDQLAAMRTFSIDKIKDIPIKLHNKIAGQLAQTMIGAQSVSDTVSVIEKLFKTQGRSRALTIVRTELGRAYATATHQRLTQAKTILPGLKKQWRRSGKIHSRTNHDFADGQIRDPDKPFRLGNGVLIMHPKDPGAPLAEVINCGCEELPWMEHWKLKHSGAKPFTTEEIAANPLKASRNAASSDDTPFLRNARKVKPDTSTPARTTAVAVETEIRYNNFETGVFIDTDGSELFRRSGQPDRVAIPEFVLDTMKERTFTHNHPNNNSFSIDDIILAADYQFEELRAIGPNTRYILQTKNHWPSSADIHKVVATETVKANNEVRDMVLRGMNVNDANAELQHVLIRRLSDILGWIYQRENS